MDDLLVGYGRSEVRGGIEQHTRCSGDAVERCDGPGDVGEGVNSSVGRSGWNGREYRENDGGGQIRQSILVSGHIGLILTPDLLLARYVSK